MNDSNQPAMSEPLRIELERRLAEHEAHPDAVIPWEQIKAEALARTPSIDPLAREGTRFRQFYVTGVTCCPSRTGFMTSKWPASFATYPANGGFSGQITV